MNAVDPASIAAPVAVEQFVEQCVRIDRRSVFRAALQAVPPRDWPRVYVRLRGRLAQRQGLSVPLAGAKLHLIEDEWLARVSRGGAG